MSEVIQPETAKIETADPCPTPLAWQEVVQSFLADRREGSVEFPGGSVTVTQFGQGQPLLVLPGIVGSPKLFALTAWLLQDDFQLWLLDRPEFCRSVTADNLIPQTSEAYRSVIRELFQEPVDLYAPTQGAQHALRMLLDEPELFRRIVLQSGWAHRHFTLPERLLLQLGRPISARLQRLPLWLSSQVANHRPWFPPYDETRFGFLLSEIYKTPINELCLRMRAAGQTDLTDSLPEISHDILLIRTEGDGQAIVKQEELLESRLPRCRTEWLHTCGHFVFLTHPHRLVKLLKQFLIAPESTSPASE